MVLPVYCAPLITFLLTASSKRIHQTRFITLFCNPIIHFALINLVSSLFGRKTLCFIVCFYLLSVSLLINEYKKINDHSAVVFFKMVSYIMYVMECVHNESNILVKSWRPQFFFLLWVLLSRTLMKVEWKRLR